MPFKKESDVTNVIFFISNMNFSFNLFFMEYIYIGLGNTIFNSGIRANFNSFNNLFFRKTYFFNIHVLKWEKIGTFINLQSLILKLVLLNEYS